MQRPAAQRSAAEPPAAGQQITCSEITTDGWLKVSDRGWCGVGGNRRGVWKPTAGWNRAGNRFGRVGFGSDGGVRSTEQGALMGLETRMSWKE